jgi:hypothetical protein
MTIMRKAMSEVRLSRWGAIAALTGTAFLIVYFTVPALSGWPFDGAPPTKLMSYVQEHAVLFFAGALSQSFGSALCVAFLLIVVVCSHNTTTFPGVLVLVGSASLLAVVLAEATLLAAVPVAAAARDSTTVVVCFTLVNGVFVRVFPLIPAPMVFAGVSFAGRPILGRAPCTAALALSAAFLADAVISVWSQVGVYAGIVLSIMQAAWFVWAAVAVLSRRRLQQQGTSHEFPTPASS